MCIFTHTDTHRIFICLQKLSELSPWVSARLCYPPSYFLLNGAEGCFTPAGTSSLSLLTRHCRVKFNQRLFNFTSIFIHLLSARVRPSAQHHLNMRVDLQPLSDWTRVLLTVHTPSCLCMLTLFCSVSLFFRDTLLPPPQ